MTIRYEWLVVSSPAAADRTRKEYATWERGVWGGWTSPGPISGRAIFKTALEAMVLVEQMRRFYPEAMPVKRFVRRRRKRA